MSKGFKPFKAPSKFNCPTKKKESSEEDNSCNEDDSPSKRNEHLEQYEVMYTKHINQKIKTWEEGVFVYNLKNFKGMLWNDVQKTECIDSKYMRVKPDFEPDEEFRTNKFLIQIVKRMVDPEVAAVIEERKEWEKEQAAKSGKSSSTTKATDE